MLQTDRQKPYSYFSMLYDMTIPQDHLFRRIKEQIDFSFVNDLFSDDYCEQFGRPAWEPEFMFKLLFLQRLKNFSDREVIEEASQNLVYKFFLDLNPEERLCDPSLLSKFRRNHIKEVKYLEQLLYGVLSQMADKGLLEDQTLILDATHTKSRSAKENNTQQLQRLSKNLRRALYKQNPEIREKFPNKPEKGADFNEELIYTKKLMQVIEQEDQSAWNKKIKKEYKKLKVQLRIIAAVEDSMPKKLDKESQPLPQSQVDPDARTGYKSEENSFFGYKSHLAMTGNRIITGIQITSGEDSDGKHLEKLVEQSEANGVQAKEVLADAAYGTKANLEYLKGKNITPYIRPKELLDDASRLEQQGMIYNKDADTLQCRNGCLAVKKTTSLDRGVVRHMYWFDIKRCQVCPYRDGCYKPGAKTRTFSFKERETYQEEFLEFANSEQYKTKLKERYKIEAKNAEMKRSHGLEYCIYRGLFGMQLQTYMTAIVADIKRMVKLLYPKRPSKRRKISECFTIEIRKNFGWRRSPTEFAFFSSLV